MDNKIIQEIQAYLNAAPYDDPDRIAEGALLLLRLNRNRVMYAQIMRRPLSYGNVVEAHLRKHLTPMLEGLTMHDVNKLQRELVEEIGEDKLKDAEQPTEHSTEHPNEQPTEQPTVPHKGKRPDHDTLPEEIQAIWDQNAERWKRIKEIYNTILTLEMPCDRYEHLVALKEAWYKYKSEMARYDDYNPQLVAAKQKASLMTAPEIARGISSARAYISKYKDTLFDLHEKVEGGADEESIEKYNTLRTKIQERITLLNSLEQEIEETTLQQLKNCGIV